MEKSKRSAQGYAQDERNDKVLVYVDGEFKPKHEATVSILDSGYVLGDGVWEGLRLVNGKLIALEAHMDRLFEGAKAISLDIGKSRAEIEEIVWQTLEKNGMNDGVHIRLMITRGKKSTPNQDPRFLISGATIVVIAEHKVIDDDSKKSGLKLFTSTFRCSSPDVFDLRLNSHSRLNLIQALIQAINAGADEALMLDPNGFVASCNSTNFFIVRKGEIWTSVGNYNFNGITRGTVIRLARESGFVVREKQFTLAETYSADEAFVTGTLGGITPVGSIDGHDLTSESDVSRKLMEIYAGYLASH